MEYEAIDSLRDRHPSWRLLRAGNATLILSFLGDYFVGGNRGACSASELASALDDHLYALNDPVSEEPEQARFPKQPREYLEDWAATDSGYLRHFYPRGDDEVHYEVTPAFEKAYAWVQSLKARPFVATESRLHTVVELLRQIVSGTDSDPDHRLDELHRRRAEIDVEIASVEAGQLTLLQPAGSATGISSSRRWPASCCRTFERSRTTFGVWTGRHARRSPRGTEPKEPCY